jgi:hypothetical protein
MKTTTTTTAPADVGNLSAVEKQHLTELRALSERRFRAVLRFTRALRVSEEINSQRLATLANQESRREFLPIPEQQKRGRLSLVVDNDLGTP